MANMEIINNFKSNFSSVEEAKRALLSLMEKTNTAGEHIYAMPGIIKDDLGQDRLYIDVISDLGDGEEYSTNIDLDTEMSDEVSHAVAGILFLIWNRFRNGCFEEVITTDLDNPAGGCHCYDSHEYRFVDNTNHFKYPRRTVEGSKISYAMCVADWSSRIVEIIGYARKAWIDLKIEIER